MSNETKTVTESGGATFELTGSKMTDGFYSATKATWLRILKLRVGQTLLARFSVNGLRDSGDAYKTPSGAIQFGCMRFSPSSVNTIRNWAGLRALPAKSRKTRKTR